MNRSIKEPSRCWECRWTRHRQCLQRTLTTLCANVHTLKGSWRRDCFMKQVEGNGRCVETPSGRGKLPYFFNRSNCLVSTLPWIDLFSDSHRGLRIELPPLRLSEAGKCRRGDIAACRWLVWLTRRPIQLNIFKRPELISMLLSAEVPNLKRASAISQHRHETVRAVSEILSFPPMTAGWWRSHRRVTSFHAVVFRRERCSTSSVALGARSEVSNISVCPSTSIEHPKPRSVKMSYCCLWTGFCANNSFVYTTPDLYVYASNLFNLSPQ